LFGAIATVMATDMGLRYEVPVFCASFGSPRVGNSRFARIFSNSVDVAYRCVYRNDPISFTPLPLRFEHVRNRLILKGDTEYCSYFVSVDDHSMENYIKALGEDVLGI